MSMPNQKPTENNNLGLPVISYSKLIYRLITTAQGYTFVIEVVTF